MGLDAQSKTVLDALEAAGMARMAGTDPAALRERMAEAPPLPPGPEAHTRDLRVAGAEGEITARVYRPLGAEGALATLVWAHGGGFVLGDLDGQDALCRKLAVDANCCVISLDYRLAPEAKFPAAPEDCYAALCFIHDNASTLGVDPKRLAVGGDSAGGNLSAVVAQLARDRGGPRLAFQLLVYPVIAWTFDTPSYRESATGYFLTREAMEWFQALYLRDDDDRHDPRSSPMAATDLSGLPPALVITAEHDPLRDEGEAYAQALQAAGVDADLVRYEGTIHGFVAFYAFIDKGKEALRQSCTALRKALHT